MLNIVVFQAVP